MTTTVADPGYYKVWKEKLYLNLKYISVFHHNIQPAGNRGPATFAIPLGTTNFSVRLRRGPQMRQSGFRGSVTGAATSVLNVLRNVYLTQKNIGGYLIVQRIPLIQLFGGTEGQGDSFLNVPWQWIAGEQMDFVLENPLNLVANLSITLFGRNINV